MELTLQKEIRRNGYIATLRKAWTGKKCSNCGWPIEPGTYYYEVVVGGVGLSSLKFPDHVHIDCIDYYGR